MVRIAALGFVLFASAHIAAAPQWPQWRGPSRDGTVTTMPAPGAWPERFASRWQVDVGEGYASPVLSDGRVFVHSRRDPLEIVTAVDAATGAVAWREEYAAPYDKNSYARAMDKGPNATPLVAGGRVFTLGATGILTAWDAATGRHLWRKDFSALVDFSTLFCGTAASPVRAHGLLVVQVGSDVRGGTIAGLDPASGEARWEWRGPGPGYASPAVIEAGGVSQLVTLTNESIVGLDARTGRELWTTPFANAWHENIVTPVWTGSLLVASNKEQGTVAYRLVKAAGAWAAREVWRTPAASMYMSTPVAADGVLFGFSDKRRGSFVALDLATGEVRWQTEGREATQVAVLLGDAQVVFLTDEARLVVARRDPSAFTPVREYALELGPTWGVPIVAGRDLILREGTRLTRLTAATGVPASR